MIWKIPQSIKFLNINTIFFVFSVIFLLLLAKNPFSERTLIPNFEPYPDTFYYITTSRCALQGKGWKLCRPEIENVAGIESSVAPLYSALLMPGFVINFDPRFFYFTNVLLALLSFLIFFLIAKKIIKDDFSLVVVLGLYCSSFYLYWFPSLAMSENALIPLALCAIYMTTFTPTKTNTLLHLVLALCIALTKYSVVIFALGIAVIAIIRYATGESTKNWKREMTVLGVLICGGVFVFRNEFLSLLSTLSGVATFDSSNTWFSLSYLPENLKFYISAILGRSTQVLWSHLPLYDHWLTVGAGIGFLSGLVSKRNRVITYSILFPLIVHILFMSLFYTADARYIIFVIPFAILLFGLFLDFTLEIYKKNSAKIGYYSIVTFCMVLFIISLVPRIKTQISVNLKYAETPWWYLSVQQLNSYFEHTYQKDVETKTRPTVITILSPFFIDFYSNQMFSVLPLDPQQDFRSHKKAVWGNEVSDNLLEVYSKKLEADQDVFVTNYGTAGAVAFQESFELIEKSFTLTLVQEGCHSLCNIYQLSPKNE